MMWRVLRTKIVGMLCINDIIGIKSKSVELVEQTICIKR